MKLKCYNLEWLRRMSSYLSEIGLTDHYIMAILDSRQNVEELLLQKLLKG